MLQLSEHLYPLDEVVISFIQSVIGRHSIKECLFWLMELHVSTNTIGDSILCLYHFFFASTNYGLDGYVFRKLSSFKNEPNNIGPLADIVCALRVSRPSVDAYLVWLAATSNTSPTRVYKVPTIDTSCSRFTGLLRSICNRDNSNTGAYLRLATFAESPCSIVDALIMHFKIPILETSQLNEPDLIYVCALIARVLGGHAESHIPQQFVRAAPCALDEIVHHFKSEPKHMWLKLSFRRLYPTHSTVLERPHGETYGRYEVQDFKKSCWHSWEYYCYDSRLWREKFARHNGIKDDKKMTVVFKDDDMFEAFYEEGNTMDFDEQPNETQMMSLHNIEVITDPVAWFQRLMELRLCSHLISLRV